MYIPSIRLAPRLLVLAGGFAMATYGALDWHYHDLSMVGFWLVDGDWRLHPLHLLMLGLCAIPVALWQILAIDFETQARQRAEDAARPDSAPLGTRDSAESDDGR